MPNAIDATKPVAGNPTTESVRANFQAAADALNQIDIELTTNGLIVQRGEDPTINIKRIDSPDFNFYITVNKDGDLLIGSVNDGAELIKITAARIEILPALVATNTIDNKQPQLLPRYNVVDLPPGEVGKSAFVIDAEGPSFGAPPMSGGNSVSPVFHDGAIWRCG